MPDGTAVLIAALSGRALAASAHRAGYRPLVTDFFGDQDTLQVAHAHVRLVGDLARGIEECDLTDALAKLSEQGQPLGIVCGSGFEDRTQLLEHVAQRWRLFGNSADTVAKIKDPQFLSALCVNLKIPFPELSLAKPASPRDWLAKRRGGAGGAHIRPALRPDRAEHEIYYQRRISGIAISGLFLADGARAIVLGFSEQWSMPTERQPYRYGGAVRPANVPPHTVAALTVAIQRLAAAVPFLGLNSADFLVDGERFWLLEINPRPGATLDIFEPPQGSLFALHMAACSGKLAATERDPAGAKATAIVYADHDIASVPALNWPCWTSDRPVPGSAIKAGEPLCTVYADGATAMDARTLTAKRRELVLAWTRASQ
ncbi:MAG: ATP-grasp domain-containing protein [Bradyrhizobiaceae bacterium]|nr:ATP-grasp domain-containing protein [Bradyrhizobiaceae bacterium]